MKVVGQIIDINKYTLSQIDGTTIRFTSLRHMTEKLCHLLDTEYSLEVDMFCHALLLSEALLQLMCKNKLITTKRCS